MTKEQAQKVLDELQETIQNTYAEGKAIKLNNVLKYIDQLESDKQKLIEKLEKIIQDDKMSDREYQFKRELALEILEILKGE